MADLVQRLTGDLTEAEQNDKIIIHAFLGAINEAIRGKVTAQELFDAFNLTTAQQNQALTLGGYISDAPNRTEFMRVFKDLMYMGEANIHPRYRDITFVNQRLQDEVTDQGGTIS